MKTITSLTIIFIIFYFSYFINYSIKKPKIIISKQDSAVNINKKILNLFHLGNKRLLSSILWVQTLLESDIKHYQKRDQNSWMFKRFDTITTIDPNFYHAYLYGGQYLSIVKDDDIGAQIIYDRALLHFPNDIDLNFHAGFHYFFEMFDHEKSYNIFHHMLSIPNAAKKYKIIKTLTARIKADLGDFDIAYNLLESAYNNTPENSQQQSHLHQQMYNIRTEVDLDCLNSKKTDCNKNDLNGTPYIKNKVLGNYIAASKWSKFRTFKK